MPIIGQKIVRNDQDLPGFEVFFPYWQTPDGNVVRLYLGDVLANLQQMPTGSVQMVVTSPPYWGLRSYETGDSKHLEIGCEAVPDCLGWARGINCAELDWANGCHVCRMVLVFRELRRVLRTDGTCWLNYGDSYASGTVGRNDVDRKYPGQADNDSCSLRASNSSQTVRTGLPSGNLVGIPWRVALALQADGWVLRQDIIWAKPGPMPESVTNRCTKAHEYIFLLTKGEGYYCDMEVIREKAKDPTDVRKPYAPGQVDARGNGHDRGGGMAQDRDRATSNKRSVWTVRQDDMLLRWLMSNHQEVAKQLMEEVKNKPDVWKISPAGYPGAHFATFPPRLIEPCIMAGTSAKGACAKCGAPWGRVLQGGPVRYTGGDRNQQGDCGASPRDRSLPRNRNGVTGSLDAKPVGRETVGWKPGCRCGTGQLRPCIVLDPFMGSGTTAEVSLQHGRWCWGIELSQTYLECHAVKRVVAAIKGMPAVRGLEAVDDLIPPPEPPTAKAWKPRGK